MQIIGVLESKQYVMHSCDNPACVKLQHLMHGSQKANIQDAINKGRLAVGEALPQAKLTVEDIKMIRRLLAVKVSRAKIALCFGVVPTLITAIAKGQIWRSVDPT